MLKWVPVFKFFKIGLWVASRISYGIKFYKFGLFAGIAEIKTGGVEKLS